MGELISRRGLVTGLIGLIAAPAIVRASSLMAVKPYPQELGWVIDGQHGWSACRFWEEAVTIGTTTLYRRVRVESTACGYDELYMKALHGEDPDLICA